MGNINNCANNSSANRYIPYLSCLRLIDLTWWVEKYYNEYFLRYIEWALWNYVQKYVALTFCDYENDKLSTTPCWGLAWIFRPLYEVILTVVFGSILWGSFLSWIVIKDYMETSGLYNSIIEDIAKSNTQNKWELTFP